MNEEELEELDKAFKDATSSEELVQTLESRLTEIKDEGNDMLHALEQQVVEHNSNE